MLLVPLCDWLKFERHDIAWPRCYHRSPPHHTPDSLKPLSLATLLSFFFFFVLVSVYLKKKYKKPNAWNAVHETC